MDNNTSFDIEAFDYVTVNHIFDSINISGIHVSESFAYFIKEHFNIELDYFYKAKTKTIIYIWQRDENIPWKEDKILLKYVEHLRKNYLNIILD